MVCTPSCRCCCFGWWWVCARRTLSRSICAPDGSFPINLPLAGPVFQRAAKAAKLWILLCCALLVAAVSGPVRGAALESLELHYPGSVGRRDYRSCLLTCSFLGRTADSIYTPAPAGPWQPADCADSLCSSVSRDGALYYQSRTAFRASRQFSSRSHPCRGSASRGADRGRPPGAKRHHWRLS